MTYEAPRKAVALIAADGRHGVIEVTQPLPDVVSYYGRTFVRHQASWEYHEATAFHWTPFKGCPGCSEYGCTCYHTDQWTHFADPFQAHDYVKQVEPFL